MTQQQRQDLEREFKAEAETQQLLVQASEKLTQLRNTLWSIPVTDRYREGVRKLRNELDSIHIKLSNLRLQ